jgi:hypothetical protein
MLGVMGGGPDDRHDHHHHGHDQHDHDRHDHQAHSEALHQSPRPETVPPVLPQQAPIVAAANLPPSNGEDGSSSWQCSGPAGPI